MMPPNVLPRREVPNGCIKNRNTRIAMVMGKIGNAGCRAFSPSTAEITVIAGVITPSASRVEAPMAAMKYAHL